MGDKTPDSSDPFSIPVRFFSIIQSIQSKIIYKIFVSKDGIFIEDAIFICGILFCADIFLIIRYLRLSSECT